MTARAVVFAVLLLPLGAGAESSECDPPRQPGAPHCREEIPAKVVAKAGRYLARVTNPEYAAACFALRLESSTVVHHSDCSGPVHRYVVQYEYAPFALVGAVPTTVRVEVPAESSCPIRGPTGFRGPDGSVVEPSITKEAAGEIARNSDPRFEDHQVRFPYLRFANEAYVGLTPAAELWPDVRWIWEVELEPRQFAPGTPGTGRKVVVDAATGVVLSREPTTVCPPVVRTVERERAIEIAREHDPRLATLRVDPAVLLSDEDALVDEEDPSCLAGAQTWQIQFCLEETSEGGCQKTDIVNVNAVTGVVTSVEYGRPPRRPPP